MYPPRASRLISFYTRPKARLGKTIYLPPQGGSAMMKVIVFITDYAMVEGSPITSSLHLSQTVANKPPPPQVVYQEILMVAESGREYFS